MTTIYRQGDRGVMVTLIQKALKQAGFGVVADGIWGPVTTEALVAFQKVSGLKPDGLAGPATLAKLGVTATVGAVTTPKTPYTIDHDGIVLKKSRRRIDYIVVHCTATREGQAQTVQQIRKDHLERGFSDIGYHYVVTLDGKVHLGRDVDLSGAHVAGYNTTSIGVSYVGGLENRPGVKYENLKAKDTRTEAQRHALLSLLMDLRKLYPYAKIQGHRDFPGVHKECPSFDARTAYRNI